MLELANPAQLSLKVFHFCIQHDDWRISMSTFLQPIPFPVQARVRFIKKFSLNKWPTCKICTWSTHFTPFIDDKWTWKIWRNFHSYSDANDKWWAENRAWVPIQWNKLQAQSVRHRAPNFKGSFRQVRSKFKIIFNRVDIFSLKFS